MGPFCWKEADLEAAFFVGADDRASRKAAKAHFSAAFHDTYSLVARTQQDGKRRLRALGAAGELVMMLLIVKSSVT